MSSSCSSSSSSTRSSRRTTSSSSSIHSFLSSLRHPPRHPLRHLLFAIPSPSLCHPNIQTVLARDFCLLILVQCCQPRSPLAALLSLRDHGPLAALLSLRDHRPLAALLSLRERSSGPRSLRISSSWRSAPSTLAITRR